VTKRLSTYLEYLGKGRRVEGRISKFLFLSI
jgi:hypothetical protein